MKNHDTLGDVLGRWQLWLPPSILALILIAVAQYDFLVFHTLAELFAIVISFIMFAFAWSTYSFSRNTFLLILACGYFWVGSLDLMHTLVYKGMGLIEGTDANTSTQFWVGTRYLEASLLISATLFADRYREKYGLFTLFGMFAVGLSLLIFSGNFPTTFIEGVGLTKFKIYSEYAINGLLLIALIVIYRFGRSIAPNEKKLITASIVMTMCAELSFTFYVDVYGLSNLAGHIFKLYSFWFIFQAIVVHNLSLPFLALQESEQQKRLIFDTIPDLIWLKDQEGIFLACNKVFESLYGASEADLVGKSDYDFVDKEQADFFRHHDKAAMDAGRPLKNEELLTFSDDGHIALTETIKTSMIGPDGEVVGVLGIGRDITQRRQDRDNLTATEARLRSILDSTGDGVYVINLEGTCTLCNPEAARMLGFDDVEQVIGQHMHSLMHYKKPDGTPLSDKDCKITLAHTLNRPFDVDDEVFFKADGEMIRVAYRARPMLQDGRVIGSVCSFRDVTERLELEKSLRQIQKMDALGNLAGGIAHDVNNMLLPIIALTEMTLKDFRMDDPKRKRLEKVIEAGHKAQNLIAGILTFSRRSDSELKLLPVDICEVIDEGVGLLRATLPSSVSVKKEGERGPLMVLADSPQLTTVLMNLASNAADAMEGHNGEFTISISQVHLTKDEVVHYGVDRRRRSILPKDGGYVKITIKDTGRGMTEEIRTHLFDPFFTTKDVGEGTGLGMAMVYGIIKKHGGAIMVSSTFGQGATFTIYLPKFQSDDEKSQAE